MTRSNNTITKKASKKVTANDLKRFSLKLLADKNEKKTRDSCNSYVKTFNKFCDNHEHCHPTVTCEDTVSNIMSHMTCKFEVEEKTKEAFFEGLRLRYEIEIEDDPALESADVQEESEE